MVSFPAKTKIHWTTRPTYMSSKWSNEVIPNQYNRIHQHSNLYKIGLLTICSKMLKPMPLAISSSNLIFQGTHHLSVNCNRARQAHSEPPQNSLLTTRLKCLTHKGNNKSTSYHFQCRSNRYITKYHTGMHVVASIPTVVSPPSSPASAPFCSFLSQSRLKTHGFSSQI